MRDFLCSLCLGLVLLNLHCSLTVDTGGTAERGSNIPYCAALKYRYNFNTINRSTLSHFFLIFQKFFCIRFLKASLAENYQNFWTMSDIFSISLLAPNGKQLCVGRHFLFCNSCFISCSIRLIKNNHCTWKGKNI